MKSRTVILLWVITIALGVTAYYVKFHNHNANATHTQFSPGEKILPNFPIQDLTQITLRQGKDSTTITRDDNNQWTVDERDHYPANHELLRNLLGALGELRVTQGYPCTSAHFGRFGVSSESAEESDLGLRITMSNQQNTQLAEVFLGKYNGATRNAMGRFIRITGDDSGVYAGGETFPGVYADPPAWLDPSFLKISRIQSISLSAPSDPSFTPWEVKKATPAARDQFKLVGMSEQEVMNITSTSTFRSLFAFTTFQDVLLPDTSKKSSDPDRNLRRQAIIKTFDGLTYTITFWPKRNEATSPKEPKTQPPSASYLLTVTIAANLPTTRQRAPDEKPEESQKKEAEFVSHQQQLKKQIQRVESFKNHIYQVDPSMIQSLQKSRSSFVSRK